MTQTWCQISALRKKQSFSAGYCKVCSSNIYSLRITKCTSDSSESVGILTNLRLYHAWHNLGLCNFISFSGVKSAPSITARNRSLLCLTTWNWMVILFKRHTPTYNEINLHSHLRCHSHYEFIDVNNIEHWTVARGKNKSDLFKLYSITDHFNFFTFSFFSCSIYFWWGAFPQAGWQGRGPLAGWQVNRWKLI